MILKFSKQCLFLLLSKVDLRSSRAFRSEDDKVKRSALFDIRRR